MNWCLSRGYQLHCKDLSSKRAEVWAGTVQEWFSDPAHPERQVGWVVPEDTPDYARPVRRLAIRWRKQNRQIGHDLLISTLTPDEVLKLLMRPACEAHEPELVALAYAQFYDQRAGAIEVEIREDKQGVGITRRRKKRAAAQAMLTLLGTLAHNVLVWAREWLGAAEPRLKQYGIVRLLRDVLCVSGFVEAEICGGSNTGLKAAHQRACRPSSQTDVGGCGARRRGFRPCNGASWAGERPPHRGGSQDWKRTPQRRRW